MSKVIVAGYIGDGREFYSGIPARDLDEVDWAQLDEAQQETVRRSRLYVMGDEERPEESELLALPGVADEIAAALHHAGYQTVEAVAAAPDKELLKIAGIGPARLKLIRRALAQRKGE
jgi:ERCC4-type nuclease